MPTPELGYQNPDTVDLELDSEDMGGTPGKRREYVIPAASAQLVGAEPVQRIAAGSGDALEIKGAPGQVYSVTIFNNSGAVCFVKLHNATGTPTPGSAEFIALGCQDSLPAHYTFPQGLVFDTGIGLTIVTGLADGSSTGVTADSVVVLISKK